MTYGITGIKTGWGPGGQVPVRREIDEWWFSKDPNDLNQRSLFIYALQAFMDMPPNPDDPHDLSYFSIAGIHGVPLTSWDTDEEKTWWYCAHNKTTFPTWHRPYLLLYEQRLYETMCKLIDSGNTFANSERAAMQHAADTWRLPYWDWAMKKPAWNAADPDSSENLGPPVGCNVPFILTQKSVQVKTVTGVATVSNPMWKYSVPPNPKHPDRKTFGPYGIEDIVDRDDKKSRPYSACTATSRQPTTFDSKHPTFKDAFVDGNELNWETIRDNISGAKFYDAFTVPEAVYRLFTLVPSFDDFAKEAWQKGQPTPSFSSCESVHGAVHDYIGGNGQMGQVALAGFDPVFWLHHCYIDRIFAMWQDVHEEKYLKWLNNHEHAKEDLAPFHMDTKGKAYNSSNCSNPQDLGYTYPELQKWLDIYKTDGQFDKEKYLKQLRTTIELLYSSTGKSALTLPKNKTIARAHMANMAPMNLAVEILPPSLLEMAAPDVKTEALQMTAPDAYAEAVQITDAANPNLQPVPSTSSGGGFVDDPVEEWNELDYVVNVLFDRFALGGQAYSIRVFLGDVDEGDTFDHKTLGNEVGLVYNFSAPGVPRGDSEVGCANCKAQKEEGTMSTGQVILTDYLVENIAKERIQRGAPLTTLSRDAVADYLRRNLHWRVTDHHDSIVPKERLPTLKISVAVAKVTHYREVSRFSEYGEYEILYAATENRLGGTNLPEDLGY